MGFNPKNVEGYKESGPEKMDPKVPCRSCRGLVTLRSPVEHQCWACYSGCPPVTRVWKNLTTHPHYLATLERIRVAREWRLVKRARGTAQAAQAA